MLDQSLIHPSHNARMYITARVYECANCGFAACADCVSGCGLHSWDQLLRPCPAQVTYKFPVPLRIRQVPVIDPEPKPKPRPSWPLDNVVIQVFPGEFVLSAQAAQTLDEARQDMLSFADATMTITGSFNPDVLTDLLAELPPPE